MIKKTGIFLLVAVILASCSKYSRISKSTNMDVKLEYAIKLYKKGQFYKALPLFEELITVFRATKQAEQTYYYYSYCNYNLGDFVTAAYDFDNFSKTFPNSEFAEECSYMHAYCFYQDSPNYTLDPTNTIKAINELQLFTDQHPRSERIAECNKLIDELRYKLETKDFQNAQLYFHMDDFKAAVTAYKNLLRDYPATQYKEIAMFYVVKSEYLLSENSIEAKKNERYNTALSSYGEFTAIFPESKFKKDADDIAASCRKRLEKMSANLN
jgi:outer membrane protein assembly factor BamD